METVTGDFEKMGRAAGTAADNARRTGEIAGGYFVEAQEINARLARTTTGAWIGAFRDQTELGRRAAQELYGTAEAQVDVAQKAATDWANAFARLLYSPIDLYAQGLQTLTRNVRETAQTARAATPVAGPRTNGVAEANGGLPIPGFDAMSVAEIATKLDDLSVGELKSIREHEKRNKNRETLVAMIDRRIQAAS